MEKEDIFRGYMKGDISAAQMAWKLMFQVWLAWEMENGLWQLRAHGGKRRVLTFEELTHLKARLPQFIHLNCISLADQQSDPID